MHIPKYWAKGSYEGYVCYRSSDRSIDDARAIAEAAARQNAERFKFSPPPADRGSADLYGYPKGPLREETLREVAKDRGEPSAVITRNALGCSVLNCSNVMFVDIDIEDAPAASGGFFKSLFGKKQDTGSDSSSKAQAVKRVEDYVRAQSDSVRIYETRGGLRILFTNRVFSPTDSEVSRCFEVLGADPLYVRLCKAQESFRARLTPKPWRCGLGSPPSRWPFENDSERKSFEAWLGNYESCAKDYATCRFLSESGTGKTDRDIAPIIELHDRLTQASSGLPLA